MLPNNVPHGWVWNTQPAALLHALSDLTPLVPFWVAIYPTSWKNDITQKLHQYLICIWTDSIYCSVGFGIIESGELLAIRQTFHSLSVFASVCVSEAASLRLTEREKQRHIITIYLKIYLCTITDPNVLKLFYSIRGLAAQCRNLITWKELWRCLNI